MGNVQAQWRDVIPTLVENILLNPLDTGLTPAADRIMGDMDKIAKFHGLYLF